MSPQLWEHPRSALDGGVRTVKAGKRGGAPPVERVYEADPSPDSCDPVLDDVDQLIMSIDCEPRERRSQQEEDPTAPVRSPGVPEEGDTEGTVPWLDRYESTNRLISQLEDTLRMMEANGCNLTNAWELANTARSLLDSADVTQALIYANRSFRMAQDIHRFPESSGVAAS